MENGNGHGEARTPRYGLLWGATLGLSLATLLAVRGLGLAFPASLLAALGLAATNAALVIFYFMHLKRESKVFWWAAAYAVVALAFLFLGVYPDVVAAAAR